MKKLTAIVLAALLSLSCVSALALQIAVPNDTTNEARALLLLAANGVIKLDENAGITATVADITDNPLNIEFYEVEAANVPNVRIDVDYAIINNNYALDAGFSPAKDSLLMENAESPYVNVLTVKEGNENTDAAKALSAALSSKAVADFITTGTLSTALLKTGTISDANGNALINLDDGTINLNGQVTANNNVQITTDGKLIAVDGEFSGEITSDEGQIGGFTIGEDALTFRTPIIVPASVTEISSKAFANCPNLTRLEILNASSKMTIADDALEGCKNVTVVCKYYSSDNAWSVSAAYYWATRNGYTIEEY